MECGLYENLHKLYSQSKTLRFELKPIGKTLDNMRNNNILEIDEKRSESYTVVKKLCDEYHKIFIAEVLEKIKLNKLDKYYELFENIYLENSTKKEDISTLKNEFEKLQDDLRKQIANSFKINSKYKGLFEKNIIEEYLLDMLKDRGIYKGKEVDAISEFKGFSTYFSGFNTNRKNMYDSEKKSTAIAYRIVDENLPIFIKNKNSFKKIKNALEPKMLDIYNSLEELMQVESIEEMFEISYFNDCLSQKGIEIYNNVISGYSKSNGEKVKGLNEYINEYNQLLDNKKESGEIKIKLPKLRKLYKQILSDTDTASFVLDTIDTFEELKEKLIEFNSKFDSVNKEINILKLFSDIDCYDLNKIYINYDGLASLSKDFLSDWSVLGSTIINNYDDTYHGKKKKDTEEYIKERRKKLDVLSINYIEECLKEYGIVNKSLISFLKNDFISINRDTIKILFEDAINSITAWNNQIVKNSKDKEKINESIKSYLDEVKKMQDMLKLFVPKEYELEEDESFYTSYMEYYETIKLVIPLYNKVRNFLTMKPYSDEKIKLNFGIPTLLDGWDVNKEKDNLGVLLRKDNQYYLGIMNSNSRKIFNKLPEANSNCIYEKMEYKLLPGPNKMLPKVFFAESNLEQFSPSQKLLDNYHAGKYKKGENFDLNFCRELIDFYKQSINIHKDWKNFNFVFKNTNEYKDISEFYKDVERQGYKVEFTKIDANYLENLVNDNKLYLFQIYNKDFSTSKKNKNSKENLHTLYWKALFDDNNLRNIVYKLNGEAEVFYRKASLRLEDTAIHHKNMPVKNKNENNPKKESQFNYDLIKNKRYTQDKFYFHVPITINFISEEMNNINEIVNKKIKDLDDINVIGIDRGERNLIYISLINSNGEIIRQESLNEILNDYNGVKYKTDYHELLDKKEHERENARVNWQNIENIKELKEGYLSQAVHKIVQLAVEYNAIIVLEDLNKGFKNGRAKVEKQVYQKFEKMLIDKLNYLVLKDNVWTEPGGVLNAYQLTNKFDSFEKMSRQSGILFYIPAWKTSKIDSDTGFTDEFRLKYKNVVEARKFFSKFDDIKYNAAENYFEFYTDYSKFVESYSGLRKEWVLCTNSTRIRAIKDLEQTNLYISDKIVLVDEFKKLFSKYDIDYTNLKESIVSQDSKEFFEGLIYLVRLMLQMRNSIPNELEDNLISPARNEKGEFFETGDNKKILCADANGAYNIARKGLMFINQIKETKDDKLNKIKFEISNQSWLQFVQSKAE